MKASTNNETYKIIVVGDIGSGKTSLIKRLVHHTFSNLYQSTIGADFVKFDIHLGPQEIISLQIWDIAGGIKRNWVTRMYYASATAALVLFDMGNKNSFKSVIDWKKDIDDNVVTSENKPIPCLLIGNKFDLVRNTQKDWGKSQEEMEKYCKKYGFLDFFKVSAKDDINISESIMFLTNYIVENSIHSEVFCSTELVENPQRNNCCR